MESLVSTFHLDWKLMIAQVVNFGIVFLVLYFFAIKPLRKLMDERSNTIKGGLENADKQKELLAAQEVEYQKALAGARAEASEMMKAAKKDVEAYRAEMMEKTQAEVVASVAAGKKQLEAEKAKMMDEAKHDLVALVMQATEKVLGASVNEKVDTKLVEESIKSI